MLGPGSHSVVALVSGPHRSSFQSLLVLGLALGCSTGAALRGSSDHDYGQTPLTFIANRGQSHRSVKFTAKGPGLTAYFTPGEVVVDLGRASIGMRFLGSNASPDVHGLDLQQGHANFLMGDDASQWRTNVPLYGGVIYRELYPGVDMVYSSQRRLLKSEFVVAPGGDPSRIRIEYRGVAALRVDERGGLILTTSAGELREEAPEIYQERGAEREAVRGTFVVSGRVVSFEVGGYDRARPLRIDPVLTYGTYLGGSGTERATAIAVDSTGAAYVTGYTDSNDFPVTGGVVQNLSGGGVEAFVIKLNAAGSAIVYSTYLGGSGDDRGFSIAVNSLGNAFVAGYTSSTNFPTAAAFQSSNGGGRDAFAVELNPTGTALVYGTYLGGSGNDSGNGIAIDAAGSAYLTGSTTSPNYPVLGAFQGSLGGGQDGLVTKLNSGGGLVYSTYLGGSLDDRGSAIAVDISGAAYVTGNTNSTNFPILAAAQATNGGAPDAFVTKLSVNGAALAYSTYLGGSGSESVELGRSIAVDSSNSAYVTGTTSSTNFPVSAALQGVSKGGGSDAFVVKLTAAGSTFAYSTYLGGSSADFGESVAVDSGGSAYVGGYTASPDFPLVSAGQPVIGGNYDAFVVKLNPGGSAITESGFLGGNGADAGYGIAVDSAGKAYLVGQTFSTDFPLLGSIQSTLGSTLAAFAARFSFGQLSPPASVSVTPSSGTGASQTFALLYSDTRGFADISWVEMNWNATQATANACYLHYDRATNELQLSNDAGSGWLASVTPGTAGTTQNTQCIVDAGASSAVGSGNNLTVNVAVSFKPAFAGGKNIYMRVQDAAFTVSTWQALGIWSAVAALPSAVSVTPSSGTGDSQIFTFVFTDPNGFADIKGVSILFQTSVTGQNACYVDYTRASNTAVLVDNAGTGVVPGSVLLGTAGSLANSQCTLSSAASSAVASGNNLTVNLSLSFSSAFAGSKNIYMALTSNAGVFVFWQSKGVWIVAPSGGGTGLLPSAVSVTPSSGAGTTQTFSFVYTDTNGFADIKEVSILFQTSATGQNACYINYTRASNTAVLIDNAGTGIVPGSVTLGTAGSLSNSQCTLGSAASSVTASGNNLTVNLSLTFSGTFTGSKNIYMAVVNNAGVFVYWQNKGVWTVLAAGLLPSAVSVTPSSGAGTTQTFSFLFTDPYGFADINWVAILIQSSVTGQNACYVDYTRATNVAVLVDNTGASFVPGSVTLGTAGSLSNSQCTLNGAASSVTASGNNLTVNLSLTFSGTFTGSKNIYMSPVNNAGVFVYWQNKGTWTTQAAGLLPSSVSVTPSSGAGTTQTFSFLYTDPYGYADINWVAILFQTSLSGQNACYLEYMRASNTVVLVDNPGTGFIPGSVTLGTAGTLSNSQCTLNAGASSVTVSGNNLTVNLSLTFSGTFSGVKNIYMAPVNNAGVFVYWQSKGTWTVP